MTTGNFLSTMAACSKMADENYDGRFMLIKYELGWFCCFGLGICDLPFTLEMAKGKTADEAMTQAMKDNVNAEDIERKLNRL